MSDFADLLPSRAAQARDKGFNEDWGELQIASLYAERLFQTGRLTASEYSDWKAHATMKYIEALPSDTFHEMMNDGRLAELQSYAGHDGSRDVGDVEDARSEVVRKVEASALDNAWLDRRISSEQYADYNRRIAGDRASTDLTEETGGDHDKAASEIFASRDDVSSSDADIAMFLDRRYGKDRPNREPEGRVVPNEEVKPAPQIDVSNMTAAEGLAAFMAQQPQRAPREERPTTAVLDRIIDHDAPEGEGA